MRRRTWSVFVLMVVGLLSGAADLFAQNAIVRGFVRDASDGESLQGVNVVLVRPGELPVGAATDADGLFVISRVVPAVYTFRVTFVGYVTYEETIDVTGGGIVNRNVELEQDQTQLDEVVVESEREGGAANVNAGLQTIRPQDIELIPAPDVSADLVNYLTALPGVVASGDRGGQLFIRGGEPTQNLVLLDGMLLYQPFHVIGFYSSFPADIVRSTSVYAGGFGAAYGGRLSSVIDVSTRNGNNRRFEGAITAAPFVSSLRLEGPIVSGRASFLTSIRESVIDRGAERLIDRELPYRFGDQFAKLHVNVSPNSQLSVSGIHTHDRGVIGVEESGADLDDAEADQVSWDNLAAGFRYVVLPATLPISGELMVSFSNLNQDFGPADDPTRIADVTRYNLSAAVTYYAGPTELNWGLFIRTLSLDNMLGGAFQNATDDSEFVTEAGAYFEPVFKLDNGLTVTPGLRLHAFPSKNSTFLEPRLRASWQKGSHRVSGAWGIYHQQVVGLNDRRDAGSVFTAWSASPTGDVPQAMHFIGGYSFSSAGGLDFSLEGFFKDLRDLSVPEWTSFPRFTINLQPADGQVLGFDVRLGLTRRIFKGFLTYGYSDVEYEATGQAIQLWYGTERQKYNPPHDRQHQVSAIGSVTIKGFDFSVRWQYGSGVPFSEAVGFDTFVLVNGINDVREDSGDRRVIYGPPYGGRLPDYHRLDVSLDKKIRFQRAAATIQVGAINIYDRSNLFFMDLFTLRRVDQLPLLPSIGVKLEFD